MVDDAVGRGRPRGGAGGGGRGGGGGGAAPPRCGCAGTGSKRERSDQPDESYSLLPVPFRTQPGIANALASNIVVVVVRSPMQLLWLLCRCCVCLSDCQSFTRSADPPVFVTPQIVVLCRLVWLGCLWNGEKSHRGGASSVTCSRSRTAHSARRRSNAVCRTGA